MGKHCCVIFSAVLFFIFRITHTKMQIFLNQPWRAVHFDDSIVWKKALIGKDAAREKLCYLFNISVILLKEKKNSFHIMKYALKN